MVTAPNQLWCMDFKGYFLTGDGYRCDPFTITDAHSRFLIRCQAVARMDLAQVSAVFLQQPGIFAEEAQCPGRVDAKHRNRRNTGSKGGRVVQTNCRLAGKPFL